MSAALPGPVQHRSLSLFFPFIQKWSRAQPLIHLTCWHWMYLHWCFLNGHRGKYLKRHKYAHCGLAQTYQDSSKPPRGLGWVALHLSTSTPHCRSTGFGSWLLACLSIYGPLFICFDLFLPAFEYLWLVCWCFCLLSCSQAVYKCCYPFIFVTYSASLIPLKQSSQTISCVFVAINRGGWRHRGFILPLLSKNRALRVAL